MAAKRRTTTPPPMNAVPRPPSVPAPPAVAMGARSVYDDQTGLTMPLVGSSAGAGRTPDFPAFGQIGRSGLLAAGGLLGPPTATGAQRVYNPERISLFELDEMSLDPVIRSCLLGYTLILQTADLSVSCADASMKALIESQFLPLLPRLLRETVRPALVFGWADAEVCWETKYNVAVEVDPGETTASKTPGPDADPGDQPVRVFPYVTAVADFVPLNNTTVTLRQTAQGQFAGLVQWGWGEAFLPPSKLFHMPLSGLFRNPYGESAIKGCYPFWYWTRFLYEMLMVAGEGCASPPLVGRYPAGRQIMVDGAQVDAGDLMQSVISQVRSFSHLSLPRILDKDGNDLFDVMQLPLEADFDFMLAAIKDLNAQKLLYMFFPDRLLQGGDVGSYALAKEHTDLFSLAIHARLDEILGCVNSGPLAQFVRYNDPDCPPAKLTYAAPNVQAMQALSQAVVQAITTGTALVTQNQDRVLVPDWKQLADQLGIPYSIVRRADGMDALGNPLQPGVSPDQQDHQAAVGAGMAPPDAQGGGQGGAVSSGGPPDPASGNGESADDFLQRTLGLPPNPTGESAASLTDTGDGETTVALGSAPKNKGALKWTDAQTDLMTHLYAMGQHSGTPVSSYGDIQTALPHIKYPHQTGGYLSDHGLVQKVKHPDTGASAFQMTDAGKEALATHLGWQGASATTPAAPAAPAPLQNDEANALHSLMSTGAQPAASLYGAKGLHTASPAQMSTLTNLQADGHIAPTGTQDDKGFPTYGITPKGGQALAAHMGGTLTPSGQAATTPPANASNVPANGTQTGQNVPAASAPLSPSHTALLQAMHDHKGEGGATFQHVMDAHQASEGTVSGLLDKTKDLTGSGLATWEADPNGDSDKKLYNLTPKGQQTLREHQASSAAGVGGSDLSGLTPGEKAVYDHVQANPGAKYNDLVAAHTAAMGTAFGTSGAQSSLQDKGLITTDTHGSSALDDYTYHPAGTPSGVPAGGKAPNAGEHKAAGGSAKDPNEAYHYEPGAAPADATGTPVNAVAPASPAHMPQLQYLSDNGGSVKTAVAHGAGHTPMKMTAAIAKGHVFLKGGKYNLSDQGKQVVADQHSLPAAPASAPAVAPTPAPEALPDGWKPISIQSDKGFKATHEGKTAVVKQAVGGQWQLLTTDGRDINAHPDTFSTKEEAFGEAGKQIGLPPPKDPNPQNLPEPEGDPSGHLPPDKALPSSTLSLLGEFSVHGGSLTNQQAHYAYHNVIKKDHPYDAKPVMNALDNAVEKGVLVKTKGGYGLTTLGDKIWQHNGAPVKADIPDMPSDFGKLPTAQKGKVVTVPDAASPDPSVADAGYALGPLAHGLQALADAGGVAPVKPVKEALAAAGMSKSGLDMLQSHGLVQKHGSKLYLTDFGKQKLDAHGPVEPIPAAAPAAVPQSVPTPPAQAAPASATPDHVTYGGAKHELTDEPTDQADVDEAKTKGNLSDKAKVALDKTFTDGKLPKKSDLHQTMAMAEAVNKSGSYSHVTAFSLQKALDYGGVKQLKEAAEKGDAEAKTHAGNLGDTSIQSDAEAKTAQAQAAKDAFQKSSVADLLHQKNSGQAGSNPGGFYTTKAGDKVYAKTYANADQAHSEHLANSIYSALGVAAPESTVATDGSKTVYASKLIDNEGTLGSGKLTKATATKALGGVAADMLLSNHDSPGLSLDNMVITKDGNIARIDNGGSFNFRAQGGQKSADDLDNLHEWDTFAPGGKNPSYAKIFQAAGVASMDKVPGIIGQISKIQQVQQEAGGWKAFIDKAAPGMGEAQKLSLADLLTKRTGMLVAKKDALQDKMGGSLDALKHPDHIDGAEGISNAFTKHVAEIDAAKGDKAQRDAIFSPIQQGFGIPLGAVRTPLQSWSGSSNTHAFIDGWKEVSSSSPTSDMGKKIAKVLEGRKERWERLAKKLGTGFPKTFHVFRGMTGDSHGDAVVPWVVASWLNEDEPYMHVKSKAAASWSTKKSVAQSFAGWHGGGASVVFETHVPFHQTLLDKFCDDMSLLTSHTHENEVICGGKEDSIVCPKSTVHVKFGGVEYSYADRHKLFEAFKKKHGSLPAPKTFGIDVDAHKAHIASLSEPSLVRLKENYMADEKTEHPTGDAFLKQYHGEVKAWEDYTEGLGTQVAPPDSSGVKPLGSFASDNPEAHAEYAKGRKPATE